MDIKKVFKNRYGEVSFRGKLSPEEHEYVLAVGLNTLMEAGALPIQEVEEYGFPDDTDLEQKH